MGKPFYQQVIDDSKKKEYMTPRKKSKKFFLELLLGVKSTNSGELKVDGKGNSITLNEKERAYRSGYLDRGRDNYKLYKYHKTKKGVNYGKK